MGTLQYLPPIHKTEKYLLEIRNRNKWILEMGGTKIMFLKRKWQGERCPSCYSNIRRQSANVNCLQCFGTGYLGGYETPIEIMASLIGQKTITTEKHGMFIEKEAQSWTLWGLELTERDIFVIPMTGVRYEILNVTPTQWHSINIRQKFSYKEIEKTNIIYKIEI